VLLNMLGRTHRDWDGAAARFVEAGIAVLAVDFRQVAIGDPESADSTRNRYASLVLDAEAARAYLAARPEVNPARIGMAGASLGPTWPSWPRRTTRRSGRSRSCR